MSSSWFVQDASAAIAKLNDSMLGERMIFVREVASFLPSSVWRFGVLVCHGFFARTEKMAMDSKARRVKVKA